MKPLMLLFFLSISLFGSKIYATFEVRAFQDAELAFTAGGIVKNVYANVGQRVRAGEVLAVLDNAEAKASLDTARIALKYAKRAYEREKKVKHLVDAAKFDRVAQAYESAKAAYAYKKALYEKTFLKAPFDGVIYYRKIEKGDAVSGMMLRSVFKIQSERKRKLLVFFDQKYITDVQIGDTFVYTIDTDKQSRSATIVKIYPHVNTKNKKVTAEAYVNDLTPGLFGDGYIRIKDR